MVLFFFHFRQVRAAFTRAYNKSSAPTPYLINVGPKKKNNQASQDEGFMDGDMEDEGSDLEEDDVDIDRMIKVPFIFYLLVYLN